MHKTLILYVFSQENRALDIFLKRAPIKSPYYEFIIIANNDEMTYENLHFRWNILEKYDNIRLYIRKNIGHDFGGWNAALYLPTSVLLQKHITNIVEDGTYLFTKFEHFIFVNSTVDGPYVPDYCADWVKCFTFPLKDDVGMVGISINGLENWSSRIVDDLENIIDNTYGFRHIQHSHVQSMVYALNSHSLNILQKYKIFEHNKNFVMDKWFLIRKYEIGLTYILQHEKISVYSHILEQGKLKPGEHISCPELWMIYNGQGLYECIFVKNNRGINFAEQSRLDNL